MDEKKYVFKKPYTVPGIGTLPEGSDIVLFRGVVYFNGGMCDTYHGAMLMNIIKDDKLRKEYLQEVGIIRNKV